MAAFLSHDVDIIRRSVEQLLDATKWDMSEIGEHDAVDLSKNTQDVISELALSAILSVCEHQIQGAEKPLLLSVLEELILNGASKFILKRH